MTDEFKIHDMLLKDTFEIAQLKLCDLRMMNDKNYPWFVLIPRVFDIQDIYQLTRAEQQQFLDESSLISKTLMKLFNGKKMNVAALGNVCPQLHIHHIVRYENDVAWPNPVWGAFPAKHYSTSEVEEIKEKVLNELN